MGRYINKTPTGPIGLRKVHALIIDGAKQIPAPTEWRPNLVCVVDNGIFDAAGYAFDERQMRIMLTPDHRKTVWLEYPHAEALAE